MWAPTASDLCGLFELREGCLPACLQCGEVHDSLGTLMTAVSAAPLQHEDRQVSISMPIKPGQQGIQSVVRACLAGLARCRHKTTTYVMRLADPTYTLNALQLLAW